MASDTKKRRMKSPSYGSELIKSYAQMRDNEELTDFVVSTEGQSFKVHKTLLAASSDYFRAMLQGVMRETKEERVDLKGLTAASLRQTLDFLYSGEMDLDLGSLPGVLNAASHLQVKAALELCSDFMTTLLNFSNAEDLLLVADTYSLDSVVKCYEAKVLMHFEEFSKTEKFARLTGPELARFVADDRLRVRSELVLFDTIAQWCSGKQEDGVDGILMHVRYGLLSEQQLTLLQNHWLVRKSSTAAMCIQRALQFHRDSANGHPKLSKQSQLRCTQNSLVMVHQDSLRPLEITAYDGKDGRFYQLLTDLSSCRDSRICSYENMMYMCRVVDCGGGTLMNSLLRFDLRHLRLQELTPCARLHLDPAVVCCRNKLFVFGGVDDNYSILDSVEGYDIENNRWTDFVPGLPQATHSLAAVEHAGSVYLCGGVSATDRQPTTSMYKFDPDARTWTQQSSMQCPRRLHEMSVLDDCIYVLGGIGSHTFNQNTQIPIEAYCISSNQWSILTGTLAGRSIGHYMSYDADIVSLGREHNGATEEDIWLYSPQPDLWRSFIKAPRRMTLASAACTKLKVNFFDEKIAQRIISDKR